MRNTAVAKRQAWCDNQVCLRVVAECTFTLELTGQVVSLLHAAET